MNTLHLMIPTLMHSNAPLKKQHNHLRRLINGSRSIKTTHYSAEASLYALTGERLTNDLIPVSLLTDMSMVNHDQIKLLACPLHCQAGMSDIVVDSLPVNDLSSTEAKQLLLELNTFFTPIGVTFNIAIVNDIIQWEVVVPASYRPDGLQPPSTILGRNIFNVIQKQRSNTKWSHFLSELQLFLHTSQFNFNRQLKGLRALNYFWLWGAANNTQKKNKLLQSMNEIGIIHDQDSLLMAQVHYVANALSCPLNVYSLKQLDLLAWLPKQEARKALILPDLLSCQLTNNNEQYNTYLDHYESYYFKPLTQWIKSPHNQIQLDMSNGKQLTIVRPSLFRRLFSL